MKYFLFLIVLIFSKCKPKEDNYLTIFPESELPLSVKQEHEDLLHQLAKITLFHDSTGLKALDLQEVMQHHFEEEENFVFPSLNLLPLLANGKIPQQPEKIIRLTEKLKLQMGHLSAEHQLIKVKVNEMLQSANKENHPEVIEFEKQLIKHALLEEEILFPSAIVTGEYLKLKSFAKNDACQK